MIATGRRWWNINISSRNDLAITWANVDPYLCRHIASLGRDVLAHHKTKQYAYFMAHIILM